MTQPEDKKLLEITDLYTQESVKIQRQPIDMQLVGLFELVRKIYKMGYYDGYRNREGEVAISKAVSPVQSFIEGFITGGLKGIIAVMFGTLASLFAYAFVVFVIQAFNWLSKFPI